MQDSLESADPLAMWAQQALQAQTVALDLSARWPAGRDGVDGVAGPAGAPGARGDAGPAGATGSPGKDGAAGPEGGSGERGAAGAAGAVGAKGDKGVSAAGENRGPAGAAGQPEQMALVGPLEIEAFRAQMDLLSSGAPGSQGLRGPAGEPGPPGPAGATGAAGSPGKDGALALRAGRRIWNAGGWRNWSKGRQGAILAQAGAVRPNGSEGRTTARPPRRPRPSSAPPRSARRC